MTSRLAVRGSIAGTLLVVLGVVAACDSFDEGTGTDSAGDDGGADAPTGDAIGSLDAVTPDGTVEVGGPAWVPCSQRDGGLTHFCDDFDHAGLIDYAWSTKNVSGGALEESAAAVSGTRAFRSKVYAGAPPRRAQLIHARHATVTASDKTRFRLSFAFRIDAPLLYDAGTGFSHLAVVEIDDAPCNTTPGGPQRSIELSAQSSGAMVVNLKGMKGVDTCDAGAQDFAQVKLPLTVAALTGPSFHRASIEVLRGPQCNGTGPAALNVSIDGVPAPCTSLGIDPFLRATTKMRTNVGLYVGDAPALDGSVTYDNVEFDLE